MTREKMAEMLSETIRVTPEEARAALEASEWSVLDAGQLLLRQARARRNSAARVEAARRRTDSEGILRAVRALFARVAARRSDAALPVARPEAWMLYYIMLN